MFLAPLDRRKIVRKFQAAATTTPKSKNEVINLTINIRVKGMYPPMAPTTPMITEEIEETEYHGEENYKESYEEKEEYEREEEFPTVPNTASTMSQMTDLVFHFVTEEPKK